MTALTRSLLILAILASSAANAAPLQTQGVFVGPEGPGRVTALARSASSPAIVYAAFSSGGIARSTDGGRTFSPPPPVSLFTTCTVACIDVHPTAPDTILAGGLTPNSGFGTGAIIARSTDGGVSWQTVYMDSSHFTAVTTVRFCPQSPQIVLAGLFFDNWTPSYWEGPMLRSTDGGVTWMYTPPSAFSLSGSRAALSAIMFDKAQAGRVLAGFGDDDSRDCFGIFRSTDYGETWARVNVFPFDGSASQAAPVFDLVQSAASPSVIFAGSAEDYYTDTPAAVFRSTNFGDSWTTACPSTDVSPYPFGPWQASKVVPDSTNVAAFRVVQSAPIWLGYSYSNLRDDEHIFRTVDAGNTWAIDGQGIRFNPTWSYELEIQALLQTDAPGCPEVLVGSYYSGLWLKESGNPTFVEAGQCMPLADARCAVVAGNSAERLVAGISSSPGKSPVRIAANGTAWTWSPSELSFPSTICTALVSDVGASQCVAAIVGGQTWRSTDSGSSWSNTGFPANMFARSPYNGSVYIGSSTGLYRTDDFAATSSTVNTGLNGLYPLSLDFGPSGLMAAALAPPVGSNLALGGGVFLSSNNGASFQKRNTGIPSRVTLRYLAWSGSSSPRIYAADDGCFLQSADGGSTWQGRPLALLSYPFYAGQVPMSVYVQRLAVGSSPSARTIWLASSNNLYRSTDDGANWQLMQPALGNYAYPRKLATLPGNSNEIWMCAYDGLYHSTNKGDSWTSTALPWSTYPTVTGFTVCTGTPARIAVSIDDTGYVSTDAGASWSPLAFPTAMANERVSCLCYSPVSPTVLLAGTGYGVWYSTNSGASWTKWNISSTVSNCEVPQIVFAPSDPSRVYCFDRYCRIFRSVSGGTTWQYLTQAGYVGYGNYEPYQLAVSPADPQSVLFGTYSNTVWKSTDGGQTFAPASVDLQNNRVTTVAVNPANSLNMACGSYSDGIYSTTDGGLSWTAAQPQLYVPVNRIVANPTAAGEFLAATQTGLYVSRNGGATWTIFVPDLDGTPVGWVQLLASSARVDVIACPENHGVWTTVPPTCVTSAENWSLLY